ncbi:ANK2 [Symbiodinium microadriaticum]|nr:ANK2 [Symbiodinium microadriaticum]
MYDVVEEIIKPLTKSRRVAFAELLEPLAPQVFVSHWWGEEFVCFVRALHLFAGSYRSETKRVVCDDEDDTWETVCEPTEEVAFWVCSFANRQWEVNLGETLQESPFERALAAPSCTHVVMIMDPLATPLQRIWCLYEVLRAHALKKEFHIATENGVLTLGSDEPFGEQREDLLRLTKRVLEIDPTTAKASQEQDRCMIMEEVDKAVGLEQFGVHVMSLLAEAFRRRGGNQLVMDAPELPMRLYRLHRLGKMFVTFQGKAQRKDPSEVRLALAAASEEDLKSCNSLGQGPLHMAAAYNRHLYVLDLLIAAAMDVNARDQNGLTPWMLSAATGHHEALSHLLARGADLSCDVDLWQCEDKRWGDKAVPNGLHLAAFSGSLECCQIFLSRNKKVHSTMLTAASMNGHVEVLQTILPHADDINQICEGGAPFPVALHSASFCGQLGCVDLLLSHRALPDRVGRLLLRFRANPWIKTAVDDSVLGVASGGGHNGCVQMLLSLRADPHETNGEDKATALHYAAQWGREQTVRLLVRSRADPMVQDEKQMTPLHKAGRLGFRVYGSVFRAQGGMKVG